MKKKFFKILLNNYRNDQQNIHNKEFIHGKRFISTKIFSNIFILLFSVPPLWSLYCWKKEEESYSWEKTEAVIESSNLSFYSFNSINVSNLKYKFIVNENTYYGNTLFIGNPLRLLGESIPKNISKNFLPGNKINVFYNKENPNESTIFIGNFKIINGTLVLFGVFMISSLLLFKKKRQNFQNKK
jgi:hypothetical protein